MTAWQSMFDAGACTVACRLKNPSQDQIMWTGTLGKGDTSPVFSGVNDFGEMQIAVDADGVVLLSSPDDSWMDVFTYALIVAPQYDVSARQTQIASGSMPGIGPNNTGLATNDGNVDGENPGGGSDPLAVSVAIGDAGAMTPSDIIFSALPNASLALWCGGS